MHAICDQDVLKCGEGGKDGSFNLEQFLNKVFGSTSPYTSHYEVIGKLENIYKMIKRNDQNIIRLTEKGKDFCKKCHDGYIGSYSE
jgi:hypothetical protein